MKTPAAITLIIVGAILILAPAVSDHLFQRNLVNMVVEREFTNARMEGQMSDNYRGICWVSGMAMIAIGVVASSRGNKGKT